MLPTSPTTTCNQWGARVVPGKRYNFASVPLAAKCLEEIWWEGIGDTIEVVKDFRYLGAHLTTNATVKSATLEKRRRDEALQQLKRLKHCPATLMLKQKQLQQRPMQTPSTGSKRQTSPWLGSAK